MNKFFVLTLMLSLQMHSLLGQSLSMIDKQLPSSELPLYYLQQFNTNKIKADSLAKQLNIQLQMVTESTGTIAEFAGFTSHGLMLFNVKDNIGSARSISTNKVWPGGTAGTALTGLLSGNRLGEWDGGAVRVSHQEFGGRVVQADGAMTVDDHATHVAGTMIASGVNTNAKGMAYGAQLRAYDWNNDEFEMSQAGSGGMLVSNHSYGTISGWFRNASQGDRWEWWGDINISRNEDYKFGFYDDQAKEWDDIASANPFYLICKSAGNDRGGNISGTTWWTRNTNGTWVSGAGTIPPADGPYDCISGTGTAKNVLTVGAVNKINNSNTNDGWVNANGVTMSNFSGWGPTDDGRIKPDIVAAGVDIFSSISTGNTDYDTYSGTSMAAPSTSGSLILVQQHHFNLKNRYMRSATLKGLAIHTADEAGNAAGPDYRFGWGLLNTAKAVKHITDSSSNIITEAILANNATYTINVNADGINPLRVTICWTDKSGNPTSISLDPTNLMLVHDLDVRIRRNSDNQLFLPYILNPAIPANNATTGDNTRDNVEQVHISTPLAGSYTITVTHKSTLSPNQPFSMLISGVIAGKPIATVNANRTSICAGNTITFTDASAPVATNRRWTFPGGNPSTSTLANVNVTYSSTGRFPVALTVSNSLGTDSTFIANYITVGGKSIPFTETFNNNSSTFLDWKIDNPDNDKTWNTVELGVNGAVFMNNFDYVTVGQRDGLISPALNLSGFNNINLSFKHAYATYPSNVNHDSLIVHISTNCGNSWTRLVSYGHTALTTTPPTDIAFVPGTWCTTSCKTIPLNSYQGMSNVLIKFENYNAFSNNLYLDDISITGTPLKPTTRFGTQQPNALCAFNTFTLIDSSLNNPISWNWLITGPDTFSSSQQNASLSLSKTGNYSVRLITSNAGGIDTLIKSSYLSVLPSPEKPNIRANKNIALCNGDSVLLTTDSVRLPLRWKSDNRVLQGATQPNYLAKLAGSYLVEMAGTNGCWRASDVLSVTTGTSPAAPVISSNIQGTTFCEGNNVVLTSTANSGNKWYANGLAIQNATAKTFTAASGGAYAATTTTNGCESVPSNTISLTMNPKPNTGTISGNANAGTFTTETYTVTNTSGSTYLWNVTGGSIVSGNNTNTISVDWLNGSGAKVTVRETASNGCQGDLRSMDISLTVGLNEQSLFAGIKTYPNPVHDNFVIEFAAESKTPITAKVYDVLGKELLSKTLSTQQSLSHTVDMSKLPNGLYFVILETGSANYQTRVMKR